MLSRVTVRSSNGEVHTAEFPKGFIVMGFDKKNSVLWQDLNGVKFYDVVGIIKKVMELNDITIEDLTDPTIKVRLEED